MTKKKPERKTRKQWYLLAYDIRHPKRLRRTHAFVKKMGVALQKSVFLIRADQEGLVRLKKGIRQHVDNRNDDVRLYPITSPTALWSAGQQQFSVSNLYASGPGQLPESVKLTQRISMLFTANRAKQKRNRKGKPKQHSSKIKS